MKKVILILFLLQSSLFVAPEAEAVENPEFWACTVAILGTDLFVLTSEIACYAAIAAPSIPTVASCAIALGFTALAATSVWLACSSLLTANQCESGPGTPESEEECSDQDGSPILLDLDRNQFHLSGGPVLFDIDSDGQPEIVTWTAAGSKDAFLYLDRNGNGVVDSGLELFGNSTLLFNFDFAENGYEALAEFDLSENGGNQDGQIDAADTIYSDLGVWTDSNADGAFEALESQSLAEAGVLSIGLDYRESPRTDGHGNEFRYIGTGWIEVNSKAKKMSTTDVYFKILAQ